MDDETAMDNVTLDDERLTREDVAHLEWARTLARDGWGRVHPNPLVGCVIVRDGRLVGQGYHEEFGGPHAEIVALREAAQALGSWRLLDCTLYATLEPCPMCVGAAVNARIKRLVYGCSDPKAGAVETLYRIPTDPRLNHRIEICSGVLGAEASTLLRSFFATLRKTAKGENQQGEVAELVEGA